MIDFAGSQTYFGGENHHKAAVWSGFGQQHRTGAIAAAKRILSRGLQRPVRENEPPYQAGDAVREEYAVYEQALWMLEHGQVADGLGSDPVPIITGAPDLAEARAPGAGLYAPEALRWLGTVKAAVVRG